VVGGGIAHASGQMLAGVREVIYERSLPLATRELAIVADQLGERAGVIGAGINVADHVTSPEAFEALLRSTSRRTHRAGV